MNKTSSKFHIEKYHEKRLGDLKPVWLFIREFKEFDQAKSKCLEYRKNHPENKYRVLEYKTTSKVVF